MHAKTWNDARSAVSPDDGRQLITWSAVSESPPLVDTWCKVGSITVIKGLRVRGFVADAHTHISSTISNTLHGSSCF